MTTPPEGDVEGPLEPVPGGQPEGEPQPWGPMPGTYGSRNAGRRQSILEAFSEIVNQSQLGEVEDAVRNQGEVIDSYGEALATKVGPEAVPTIAPLSQTINRRADPTFQLSDFMAPPMSGTDSRGDTVTVNPAGIKQGASTKGVIYYSFITPLINRAYEQLNFMVSGAPGTSCQMDVAIYTLDPATKTLTQQVLVEDAAAGLTFNESVVTIAFPRWVAEQGSYVCIAWLQHGTGEARSMLGLDETQRPLTDMVFPPKISAIGTTVGDYTALPATVDGGNSTAMNFPATWFTPYAELSEAISIILRYFQDPFTTDNNQYIARPWVGLTSQEIRVSENGWAGVISTTFIVIGPRVAVYDTPLSTDRAQVTARIQGGFPQSGPDAFSFLAIRTTNNMGTGVGVFYNDHVIQIRSWSGATDGGVYAASTVRTQTAWTLGSSRNLTATWTDGVAKVYNEQGTEILSWADTVTSAEPRYRFTGIGFERISGQSSPRLDHWTARDLPATVEEEDQEV